MKNLEINTSIEIKKIVNFIRLQFKLANRNIAIVGISGGIDSACIASLCVKALGKENVVGVMLPYGEQFDINDSQNLITQLGILSNTVNIKPMVDSFKTEDISDYRLGNIKARVRMTILYDFTAKFKGLVVGTSNRTELLLGYFTLHGDGAVDMEPIGHLYKAQVKQLAIALNIPNSIISKAPSAGLWEGQTDESELGLKYAEIDNTLKNMNIQDILKNKYYDIITINNTSDVFTKVAKRIRDNRFKLQTAKLLENIL